MDEQNKILYEFISKTELKQKGISRTLLFILPVSLLVGFSLLAYSIVGVKKRLAQINELDAQIQSRKEENERLERRNEELKRYLAKAAPYSPPEQARELNAIDISNQSVNTAALVEQFSGDNRLIASNQLIQLYKQNTVNVVQSLINGIQPEERQTSYRVNLYIAFTLGRIDPFWEGDQQQLEKIKELRTQRNYKDETFRKWVDESIKRFREIRRQQ